MRGAEIFAEIVAEMRRGGCGVRQQGCGRYRPRPPSKFGRYRPHLDRWPDESANQREITILYYVNPPEWDAELSGGCLRLHAADGGTTDVAPRGGRLVIFKSGEQMHEVMPAVGVDRLAITLWVEYGETVAPHSARH